MRKFFLILLLTIISAHPVSIGSCSKYSADGQSCEQCITNYHLYEGSCYVDILGCKDYQFGNICHQCDKNYILVNNLCCDMVCMSKIFSKFKKQVKQQTIANNTQILSELIPFAQTQYLKDTTGRLIAIEVKQYQEAKRFFLLYEFYESEFYSKRLIVDYVIKTKKYVIVDWSLVKNSWKYGIVQWTEVEDDASILLFYPNLYPSEQNYTQVVARKAIMTEVDQYEIATLVDTQLLIRTLYTHQQELVLLQQTRSVHQTSTPVTESNQTAPTVSNQTDSTVPTNQSSSTPASNTSTTNTTTQPPPSTFFSYELKYQGVDILGELDVNDALIAAFNEVKANEKWNHSLTLVVESAKIPDVVEFLMIGENKETGSIIKFDVKYIKSTQEAYIISISEEIVQITSTVTVTNQTVPSVSNGTSTHANTSTPTIQESNPTVTLTENKVYIVEQGCSTHTYYISPLSPDIEAIASTLQSIKQQAIINSTNSSNPIIANPGLNLRRLVISQNCQGSQYKEVAYIEGDTVSTKEYFTYYLEVTSPNKTWYYLGVKNKSQTATVYSNPYAYPIYVSDPSFLLYPSASLYYQTGIDTLYSSKLSSSDQTIFQSLTTSATSEKDRAMGKVSRFAIDGIDQNNSRYRMTGWQIIETPSGLTEANEMISLMCEQSLVTESVIIGTNGPVTKPSNGTTTTQNTTTTLPTGEVQVTTTISTSVLGDQTVTSTNVNTFLNEDQILQEIMQWLISHKEIVNNYQLSTIQISEYNQALEYHLDLVQKNSNQSVSFQPSSQIRTVIVHDKISHENILISFEMIELVSEVNNSTTNSSEVHAGIDEKVNDDYVVVVDVIKTEEEYQQGSNGTNGNSSMSNETTTNTPIANSTVPTNSTPTTDTPTPSSNTTSTPVTPEDTPTPIPSQPTVNQQQRIKQLIDTILQQLPLNYQIPNPILIQALEQVSEIERTVKLTLVVNGSSDNNTYSVVAIGHLDSQNDPIIESVKLIAQEIVDKLVPVANTTAPQPVANQTTETATNETTPKVCDNTQINTEGKEVCLDESTSGETDIQPGQQVSNTTQTNATVSTNSSSNTTTAPTIPIETPTTPTSDPSDYVSQLIEEKSFEETVQIDGEIRKIYVNPLADTLSEEVKQIVQVVVQQETKLQQAQLITQTPVIKIKAIELAATTVYIHYAITIKIIYTTTIVIRRYYYIVIPSTVQQIYMGHSDLASSFDPTLKENRAFTNLTTLQPTTENEPKFYQVINTLNIQYKTTFIIINIIYYRYRVFPLGNYLKITLKNDTIVGNLHLIDNNANKTTELVNWHQEVIADIIPVANVTESNSSQTVNQTVNQPTNQTTTSTNQTSTPTTTNQTASNQTSTHPTPSNTTTPSNSTVDQSNTTTTVPVSNTTTAETQQPSNQTNSTTTTPLTPQQIINQEEITTPDTVVINLSLEEKLGEVLRFLSQTKSEELSGGSLEQYAASEDKSLNGTLNAVQFDLYFLKFVSDTLLREFICSVIRHEADGKIDIALFLSNDINLGEETPAEPSTPASNTTTTPEVPTQPTQPTQPTGIETQVKEEQHNMNSDFVLVDPNELFYSEAISLIDQDPSKSEFDEVLDLNNLPSSVLDVIKFLRAKFTIIKNAGGLRIVKSTKTTTIQRFRVYFFNEKANSNYELYRAVLDYNTETVQTKYIVVSFELYANNHQLSTQPSVADQSVQDDTDVAYGYVLIDLETISSNKNIQNIIRHLNTKYHEIVYSKNVTKIEELKLFDGRINYKIVYRDPATLSEFKFIVFYQPQLEKVLVLNSVNLPHHSQYNQLTPEQQKTDSLFSSVLSYMNSIHPEISGFSVKSVSKATETTFSEYQLVVQSKNKKFKSLIRSASNNVDLSEINFSELVQISLDRYKLDQFDEMFIMNYQKLSQEELRSNSKLRIILSFLYNSKKINPDAHFLGAAYKPFGLGFMYKVFFKVGVSQELIASEVYIEAYSDKISLKSFKNIDFTQNLFPISVQESTMSKIVTLIKQKTSFLEFTVQNSSAKDFFYGTLYKFTISTKSASFDVYVYHDHSTEEISPLFYQESLTQDQCVYEGSTCKSCLSESFRLLNNKCVQNISNCLTYESASESCQTCSQTSELINGMCIQKANCGGLCQIVSI